MSKDRVPTVFAFLGLIVGLVFTEILS